MITCIFSWNHFFTSLDCWKCNILLTLHVSLWVGWLFGLSQFPNFFAPIGALVFTWTFPVTFSPTSYLNIKEKNWTNISNINMHIIKEFCKKAYNIKCQIMEEPWATINIINISIEKKNYEESSLVKVKTIQERVLPFIFPVQF